MSSPSRFSEFAWILLAGVVSFAALCLVLDPVAAGFTAFLAVSMGAITWTDFRSFIVPDVISLPAIPIGIAANVLVMHDAWTLGMTESLWGAALGGGALYFVRAIYFRLRKIEGLGLGDVKLGAVAGAWLGPGLLAPACLAATVSALLAVLLLGLLNREAYAQRLQIPFGSFIAPIVLLFWVFRLWGLNAAAS
jgi:leader peptidase (prepilin peptidase)/N-methyltransferase